MTRRVLYHALFWVCYYMFYGSVVLYAMYGIHDLRFYLQFLGFFPFEIALVYLNLYVLIPKLLYEKRYFTYGGLLVVAMSVSVVINQLLKQYYTAGGSVFFAVTAQWNIGNIISTTIERIYLLGFTTGVKLAKDSISHIQSTREREKQYLETELNFLKSQIQPHFFFNTLNNLYSLTLNKSDRAPDVVLKLSELMSYMLYDSNTAYVSLDKEIDYLQNFMDLEQLRFGDRMTVHFSVDGKTEDKKIPPLILILFVENSFKHGVKNTLSHIDIESRLTVTEHNISFSIINPISAADNTTSLNGIGLKNVKRRLDLLYGAGYTLDLNETDNKFITILRIPL